MSGDTGYDPAIRMLQEYGVRISRLPDVQDTAAAVVQEEAEVQKKPLRDLVQDFMEGSGTTYPLTEYTTGHKKPLTETEWR